MNSETNCNHISVLMDWADRIALTDNSNGLYWKGFIWLFHDFDLDFCVEWVGRDTVLLSTRPWHRPSSETAVIFWTCHWYKDNRPCRITWQLPDNESNLHNYFSVSHARSCHLCLSMLHSTFALLVLAIALWEGEGEQNALAVTEEEQTSGMNPSNVILNVMNLSQINSHPSCSMFNQVIHETTKSKS